MKIHKIKVNVCSLAAEARLIRQQANAIKRTSPLKGRDERFQDLYRHRSWHLRNESRAAQLVYAFVRGVPYRTVEPKADHCAYKWYDAQKRARSKCRKLGLDEGEFNTWLAAVPVETG